MKIALLAYVNGNFGDDLFIREICERYPSHQFVLCHSTSQYKHISDIPNLLIPKANPIVHFFNRVIRKVTGINVIDVWRMMKCHLTVYIGGSIFIQSPNEKEWKNQLRERKLFGKVSRRFYIVSANFGPYTDEKFLNLYEAWFSTLDDICFRDRYSRKLFQKNAHVRNAPDALFAYPLPITAPANDGASCYESGTVVINYIDTSWRDSDIAALYESKIAELISFYRSMGKKIVLLTLCVAEGDANVTKRLEATVSFDNVEIVNYQGDVGNVLHVIASCEFIIATRFHAILFALRMNIPMLPIVYSKKTTAMLMDAAYSGESMSVRQFCQSDIQTIDQYRTAVYTTMDEIGILAHEQFSAIDQMLIPK